MKKSNIFLTILVLSLFLGGCKNKSGPASKEENFDKDASYALGMFIGSKFIEDNTIPNPEQFLLGVKDALSEGKTRFSKQEALQILETAYDNMLEKREIEFMQKGVESIQKGIDFLVENSKKPGIITTSSGLQYEVIKEGNGKKPSESDIVRAHYEGRLIDGTVFDNSYNRGEPAEFPLEDVIAGWTEGVQLMSVGSKYKFYIPSELGYGDRGASPVIPPNSVLIFEVELLDILNY